MNIVVLLGRMVADPELKSTPNGIYVCSFRIAVERDYTPKGQERQADFITCVTWRSTAEFVSRYFNKGKMIAVQGSLQTRNYEDKYGNKRTVYEVVADKVNFAGDKGVQQVQANHASNASSQTDCISSGVDDYEEITTDEDLPF